MKNTLLICFVILISIGSQAQNLTNGLVAHYPFNGNGNDISGNNNHGNIYGATPTSDRFGSNNSAYSFDGINDYATFGDSPFDFTTSFTLSFWMKTSTTDSDQRIFFKNSTNARSWFLSLNRNTSGKLTFFSSSNGYNLDNFDSDSVFNDNKWNHVVLVYDGTNNTSRFYKNGHPAGVDYSAFSSLNLNNADFSIANTSSNNNYPECNLDEVRVYNRALTNKEIQLLAGNNVNTNGLRAYYPFTGNAMDSSGNNYHGIVQGATLANDRFENPNSAYYFDGINDYIDFGNQVGNGIRTISLWFKPDEILTPNSINDVKTLLFRDYALGGANQAEFGFFFSNFASQSEGSLYFTIQDHNNNHHRVNTLKDRWTKSHWHNIIVVIDSLAGTSLYLNGELIQQNASHTNATLTINEELRAGIWNPTGSSRLFNGYIDDITIYEKAISQTEIDSLATNRTPNPFEPYSYFKVSDTQGNFNATLSYNDNFGCAIDTIGDLNNDGVGDLVASSQKGGAVYVLFMNSNGTVSSYNEITDTDLNYNAGTDFGVEVTCIGDINNDGVNDIAIGDGYYNSNLINGGAVIIACLNSSGNVISSNIIANGLGGFPSNVLQAHATFGWGITAPGDLNGDGHNDLIVGARRDNGYDGAVYVLYMQGDSVINYSSLYGNNTYNFGVDLDYIGDLNNDGKPEIAIGEQFASVGYTNSGAIHIYTYDTSNTTGSHLIPYHVINNNDPNINNYFGTDWKIGHEVIGIGDYDGDGVEDIATGAPQASLMGSGTGAVYIMTLNSSGSVKAIYEISKQTQLISNEIDAEDRFGSGLAFIKENYLGNGSNLLLVGARKDDDGGTDRGAFYGLYLNGSFNASVATTQPQCYGDCTGTATVTATGSGPFNYVWSTGASGSSISNLCAGNYSVTIFDANGDSLVKPFTITEPLELLVTTSNDTTLCDGGCVTVSANASGGSGAAVFYFWQNLGMGQNKVVCPTTSTDYIVYALDANGCYSEADTITVTVSQKPTVSFSGLASEYCANDPAVSLSGNPTGGTFSGNGISGASFNPATAGAGTHSITYSYTNAAGCSDQHSTTVVVHSLPSVSFSGLSSSYCDNEMSSTLVGSPAGGTFSGSGVTANIFDPTAVSSSSTSITYQYTDTYGCSNSASQSTTINTAPVANAGNDMVIASGTNITLSGSASGGSGFYSYSWSPASKLVYATVQNPTTINLSSTEVFSVTVTDLQTGCISKDSVTIYVSGGQLMAVANATSSTICQGDSTQLQVIASGGIGNYSYSWSSSQGSFSSSSANPVVYPTANTTYTVTVTSGTSNTTCSTTVNVNPTPSPAFTSLPSAVCENGNNVQLSATPAGGSFFGAGVSGTTFTPISAGVGNHNLQYSVTNAYGCSAQTLQSITVNAKPTVQLSGLQSNYCIDDAAVNIAVSPQGGTLSGNGVSGTFFNPSAAGSGTHSIVYTYVDANSCSNSTSKSVNVNPLPVADAGPDKTLACNATSVSIGASNNPSYSYLWMPATGLSSNTIANPQATPADTTTYILTVTNTLTGCVDYDTVVVEPAARPTAVSSPDTSVCMGDVIALNASGGISYSWNNGASGASINVSPVNNAQFIVTVTDANGCIDTDTTNVTVIPSPTANVSPDVSICQGESTTLTASGGLTYNWSNSAQGNTISVNPSSTTTYFVTVTNVAGCSASDQVTVTVNPNPVVEIIKDTTICAGEQLSLSTNQMFDSYLWSNSSTNATINTPALMDTTMYWVSVTDINGCQDQDTVVINVKPVVDGIVSSDTAICYGQPLTLTASGGTDYFWSNGPQSASNPVSPTINTEYHVTITKPGHCTDIDTIMVDVNPIPYVWLGPDQAIDPDDSLLLDAGAGFSAYLWQDGSTSPTYLVDGPMLGAGNYTFHVLVTDNIGCSNGDTINIDINDTTGIENITQNDIKIFPNPTKSLLNLVFEKPQQKGLIEIVDMNGNLVESKRFALKQDMHLALHVEQLANGIYAIRIITNDKIIIRRFVKN